MQAPAPTIVDLRINETLSTGAVRKPPLPFSRLVGTVSNSADVVRLETAPTGGESIHLFLEFNVNRVNSENFMPPRPLGCGGRRRLRPRFQRCRRARWGPRRRVYRS